MEEVMEYLYVGVAALVAGMGAGAYLHYRFGASVKRVADIVGAAVEQAKSK